MAVRVAGSWEFGWNTPIKEMDLWEFCLKEFLIDEFHMCPVSGILNAYVTEHSELGTLLASLRQQGVSVVFVDETAATPLPDFQHPADVIYVFGKASTSLYTVYNQPGDSSVSIPTVTNQGGFWPHQAASLILYDRMLKG